MKIALILLGTTAFVLSVDASMTVLKAMGHCYGVCAHYCQQNYPNCQQNYPNKPGCQAKCEAKRCSGN
jgi:hypothetical protein